MFTVDTTLQADLNKNFDDYRKKELFEFRPFYLAKLRAVLDAPGGPKTYEFEKVRSRRSPAIRRRGRSRASAARVIPPTRRRWTIC